MKMVLYYHILLDENQIWSHIFTEQFKLLEDMNLLHEFESVKIAAITDDGDRLMKFIELAASYRKVELDVFTDGTDTVNFMAKKIWNDSQEEDFYMLYLHTKNIALIDDSLRDGDVQTFKNGRYRHDYLNRTIVENWKDCIINLMRGRDLIVHFDEKDRSLVDSFWWTKSNYIRMLPQPH